MNDETTPTPEDDFFSLLSSAPLHDDVLDGFVHGFDVQTAREILHSEDKLGYLREIALGVAPSAAWTEAATAGDELGRLNLDLLTVALEARAQAYPAASVSLEVTGGERSVTPSRIADVPQDLVGTVQLDDGVARFSVEDLSLPPAVAFTAEEPPAWVAELLGEYATETLAEEGAVLEMMLDDDPQLAARYALGLWLLRWHPGTGDLVRPFDESLIRVELGVLAWNLPESFGMASQARQWLADTGPALVRLAQESLAWRGWRRRIVDQVLLEATDTYVSALPDAADVTEVRRLHEALVRQDEKAQQLVADSLTPEDFVKPQSRESALIAGAGAPMYINGGICGYDPRRVPARSVMAGRSVSWQAVRRDGIVELQVAVIAGEHPVDELLATVICDDGPEQQMRLPHQSDGYSGTVELPWPPDHVEIHVHHASHPGELRPESEWVLTSQMVESIIRLRRDLFDDAETWANPVEELLERPFLCELAAWYPSE